MKSSKISLAFVLAFAVVAVALPLRRVAAAANEVPIKGSFTSSNTLTVNFPFVHVASDGVGQMSHLGRTTVHSDIDILIGVGTVTGTATYTAANGDKLTATISGFISPPDSQGVSEGDLIETFTGGTGRFSGASGSVMAHVVAQATAPTASVALITLRGTVSSVGSN